MNHVWSGAAAWWHADYPRRNSLAGILGALNIASAGLVWFRGDARPYLARLNDMGHEADGC